MSTTDLYAPDFPHGTPRGFDLGCRSSAACPSELDLRLSCRTAWQKNAGDYKVAQLFAEGATPAEVAAYLNPPTVEPEPAKKPAAKPAAPSKRRTAVTSPAPTAKAAAPAPAPAPSKPKASTRVEEPEVDRGVEAFVAATAKRTGPTKASRIREWARENGYDVPRTGRIPYAIVNDYEAAHRDEPTPPSVPTGDDWKGVVARAYDDTTPPAPTSPTAPSDLSEALLDARTMAVTPPTAEPARAPRPTWAEVNYANAMERARSLAVHLEQLLAETERQRELEEARANTAEAAVIVLLERWEAANQTIAHLHGVLDDVNKFVLDFPPVNVPPIPVSTDAWTTPATRIPQPVEEPRPTRWQRLLAFLGMAD